MCARRTHPTVRDAVQMTTVAIYTRLSLDKGGQTATSRQRKACEMFAGIRNWEVGPHFEDVDVSAYMPGVVRSDYEAMLAAITTGAIQGVLIWKLDRLVRRPSDFERFWKTCEAHGVFLASATEPIDSTTDLGVALVRILVAFASLESATIGTRVRAMQRERAYNGLPPTTAPVYGLRRGWREVEPTEALHVREAARRVVDGASLRSIALDWNHRGLRPPRAEKWTTQQLRKLLLAHRLVGDREYRGEVVATDCFPAVLDRATADRVRVILTDAHRQKPPASPPHWLHGLMRCGACGSRMHAQTSTNGSTRIFRCPMQPRGCGRVAVSQQDTIETVIAQVGSKLADRREGLPRATRSSSTSTIESTLDNFASALSELAHRFYVERAISRAEYQVAKERLENSLDHDSALYEAWLPPDLGRAAGTISFESIWNDLPHEQQREIVVALIDNISIRAAPPSGAPRSGRLIRFDPTRVTIAWHESAHPDGLASTWLSTREAAALLELSVNHIYELIRRGDLYAERVGAAWLISRTSISEQSEIQLQNSRPAV